MNNISGIKQYPEGRTTVTEDPATFPTMLGRRLVSFFVITAQKPALTC